MPTYEYECRKCGKKFDFFQKMLDLPLKQCIHCRGRVDRLIGGGAGLIFKGSGFYETDYKKKPEARDSKKTETSVPKKENKTKKE